VRSAAGFTPEAKGKTVYTRGGSLLELEDAVKQITSIVVQVSDMLRRFAGKTFGIICSLLTAAITDYYSKKQYNCVFSIM